VNGRPLDLPTLAIALGGEIRGGQILAPGPDHSSADRSLAVKLDPGASDGFIVHSHAGDDPRDCRDHVRSCLGLPAFAARQRGPRVVAEYVYQHADRTPHLRVQRTRDKLFWQYHWTGAGWAKGNPAGGVVPYRLPELIEAIHDTVFVVEGEKDADRLAALGFIATTAPGGAGKWPPELNKWFRAKNVFVLADNDDPGRTHASIVAGNLNGLAASVRVVELPGLPSKGDVSDWLDAGGDPDTLVDLCQAVAVWARPSDGSAPGHAAQPRDRRFTLLRDIEDAPRKNWLMSGLLGEGELSFVYGPPGCGKSVVVADMAAHVAAGREWRGHRVRKGSVLYVAAERAGLVKRRLAAWRKHHGIGDAPIAVVAGSFDLWSSRRDAESLIEIARDLEAETGEPVRWIVIDTVAQVLPGGDENSAKDMSALAANLSWIQSHTGAHVTGVHHVPHGDASRMRGSGVLLGAADTTLSVENDDTTGIRTLKVRKANDAPDNPDKTRTMFSLMAVRLGVDQETGEVTTAPVVVDPDRPDMARTNETVRLSRAEEMALKALGEVIHVAGEALPDRFGVRGDLRGVSEERWRSCCYRSQISGGVKQDSKRTAFNRASIKLQRSGFIAVREGLVWLTRPEAPGQTRTKAGQRHLSGSFGTRHAPRDNPDSQGSGSPL